MKLGYNLDQIVETSGHNSINMTAIKALLDERLAPFASQQQQQNEEETTKQNGIDAYNKFMQRFPDAAPHQEEIAAIASQSRITPEDAYFQLRTWAAQRGFDFSKPLTPQIQVQRDQLPANPPSVTAPLPNGGTPPNVVTDTPPIADDDVDYDDIIKAAMRDAGMQIK